MLEEGALKYVPPSKCLSREQEIQSTKPDKKVIILEDQQLHVKTKGGELATDLSNELRVHNALVRRCLAADMVGLATFGVMDRVNRELMSHLTRPFPPRFCGPDIGAVLRADQELWTRVAERCQADFHAKPDGSWPVDVALIDLLNSASVSFFSLPIPTGRGVKLECFQKASTGASHKIRQKF